MGSENKKSPVSSFGPSEDSLCVWIFLGGNGNVCVDALLRFFYSVRPDFSFFFLTVQLNSVFVRGNFHENRG